MPPGWLIGYYSSWSPDQEWLRSGLANRAPATCTRPRKGTVLSRMGRNIRGHRQAQLLGHEELVGPH